MECRKQQTYFLFHFSFKLVVSWDVYIYSGEKNEFKNKSKRKKNVIALKNYTVYWVKKKRKKVCV